MFPTWADRVKSKGEDKESLAPLVTLHLDRWAQWYGYIKALYRIGFKREQWIARPLYDDRIELEKQRDKINADERRAAWDALDFQIDFISVLQGVVKEDTGTVFSKVLLRRDSDYGSDYVLLDASFGSMNSTSDLDVNVVSTTPEVLYVWMKYTRAFVKSRSDSKRGTREYAASFCEFWDSNFYYEPGVWTGDEMKPWTKVLMDESFVWTTKDTALYELQCVKAYCDAYETKKNISVDGMNAVPCPEQMDMAREQDCYETALHFAEMFRAACEQYQSAKTEMNANEVRFTYLKYAVTKIEALVSVTSLAVCRVFGPEVFNAFLLKEGIGKLTPYMSAIAGYEMLRNLRMHSHDGKYKSKYANRLRFALYDTPGLCDKCRVLNRFTDDSEVDTKKLRDALSVEKTNSAALKTLTDPIAVFLDFMDGEEDYGGTECPYRKDQRKWLRNLNGTLKDLCARAYDYTEGLIKEETSEKKKGTDYVKELIES